MGWLELLPLLKRALPLLDRLAPLLESTLARGGVRAELERTTSSTTEIVRSQSDLKTVLDAQSTQLRSIATGVKQLQDADEFFARRLQSTEEAIATLRSVVRVAGLVVGVLLIAVVTLLVMLLHRHA